LDYLTMAEYSTRAIELAQQLRDKAELRISQRSTAVAISCDPIMEKRKKTPVVSAEDVTYWYERMSSGRERFSPVVEKWFASSARTEAEPFTLGTALYFGTCFGIVGLPFGVVAAIVSGLFFDTGAEALAPVLVGSALTTGFAWQPFTIAKTKKAQYLYQQILTHTSQGLVSWMQARYGLTISAAEAGTVAKAVLGLDRNIPFTDISGKPWLLKLNKKSEEYQVEEVPVASKKLVKNKKKKSQQLSLSKEIASTKPVALPDEANTVFQKIKSHLGQLNQLSLNTENMHIINRVADDVREAVSAYEKLQVLGAETIGGTELTRVLGLLDTELAQIIQDEIDVARGTLVSHGDYVQARQKNGLQLPSSSSYAPF
jgi:hypothetical protein